MKDAAEITLLLQRMGAGDSEAGERLYRAVYHQLKRIARALMRSERADHTLQPTALVNEAFLRLPKNLTWQSRKHFQLVAARAMRRVLVDHARARNAQKRPPRACGLELVEPFVFNESDPVTFLAVNEALDELATKDARQARVVELLFFAGLTQAEIASALDISLRQVKRDWRVAKLWLYAQLRSRSNLG